MKELIKYQRPSEDFMNVPDFLATPQMGIRKVMGNYQMVLNFLILVK